MNDVSIATALAHREQVNAGERFEFGRNWRSFLAVVDDERIVLAERSLLAMLNVTSLRGMRFLDAGSGSGLLSLAARRLGANVTSFDYDSDAVACTAELKRRYFDGDTDWQVLTGSVLDRDFLESLGAFDVVYAWGVLHHTGAMWEALANVLCRVRRDGLLFISIYNDQGQWSHRWRRIKHLYNKLPSPLQTLYAVTVMICREARTALAHVVRLKVGTYVNGIRSYSSRSMRGMSYWRDVIDWVGGYPFEVATPEAIFRFVRDRDFVLTELTTIGGGSGCNQFVFRRGRS